MIRPLPSYVLWLSILYVPRISDLDRAFFILNYNLMDSFVVCRKKLKAISFNDYAMFSVVKTFKVTSVAL